MSGETLPNRDTAGAILTAAKEQFLAAGYEKATVRGICAGAGVSIGAFYHFFQNKEAVFAALAEPTLLRLEDTFAEARPDAVLPFLFEHRDGLLLLLERSAGSRFEDFPDRVRDRLEQLLFHCAKTAGARDLDPDLTRILAGMCFSALKDLAESDGDCAELVRIAIALQTVLEQGFRAMLSQQNNG